MPAKTVLFDQHVRTLHDFGASPHNFISFNPQGRLIALAGFGNLAGKLDIIDRRTLGKVCTIDAPNTSHCEWSSDGRFILTATLSPRLRVDNGIKIWHCTGPLVHVQLIEELYQASWRPAESAPPFGQTIPPAPAPSASLALLAQSAKPVSVKPAGAYRPPGARGLATPTIFKREDEGGEARRPTDGAPTPPRNGSYNNGRGGPPGSNGLYVPGSGGHQQNNGRRYVPGAPPSGSAPPEDKDRKMKKKKEKKRDTREDVTASELLAAVPMSIGLPPLFPAEVSTTPATPIFDEIPPTPGVDTSLDPIAKKIRNLTKKVR